MRSSKTARSIYKCSSVPLLGRVNRAFRRSVPHHLDQATVPFRTRFGSIQTIHISTTHRGPQHRAQSLRTRPRLANRSCGRGRILYTSLTVIVRLCNKHLFSRGSRNPEGISILITQPVDAGVVRVWLDAQGMRSPIHRLPLTGVVATAASVVAACCWMRSAWATAAWMVCCSSALRCSVMLA